MSLISFLKIDKKKKKKSDQTSAQTQTNNAGPKIFQTYRIEHLFPCNLTIFFMLRISISRLLSDEKAPRVIDQITGAVCRLILANKNLVPLDAVVPVVLQQLPMREDLDEYAVVFQALTVLFADQNPLVANAMPNLVAYSLILLNTDEEFDREKVLPLVHGLLQKFKIGLPEKFSACIETLPEEQRSALLAKLI